MILTTSRAPLELVAETCVRVEPLAVPAMVEDMNVAECVAAPAVALFTAAAARHGTHLEVDDVTAPPIARICAQLDGLPLALELAAARTVALSVTDLAERLGRAVTDLGSGPRDAPARQRTLAATIDWSYQLLGASEHDAAMRFAVFAGGATLDSAERVTGASLHALESLLANCLLYQRVQADGKTRLEMLETVRQYSVGLLESSGESDATRRRHFQHYLDLVEQTVPMLRTSDVVRAAQILEHETNNIRAALKWAISRDPSGALKLAGSIAEYWSDVGDSDSRHWLESAIAAAGDLAPVEDRARAQFGLAKALYYFASDQSSIEAMATARGEAQRLYEQLGSHAELSRLFNMPPTVDFAFADSASTRGFQLAVDHARIAGDNRLLGEALVHLSLCLPHDKREPMFQEGVRLVTDAGDYRFLFVGHVNAAWVALREFRPDEALTLLNVAKSVPLVRSPVIDINVAANTGDAHLLKGDPPGARSEWSQVLQLARRHAVTFILADALVRLGAVAAGDGTPTRAARILGAARRMAVTVEGPVRDYLEKTYLQPARALAGPEAWASAERQGAALTIEQAIAYALEPAEPAPVRELPGSGQPA